MAIAFTGLLVIFVAAGLFVSHIIIPPSRWAARAGIYLIFGIVTIYGVWPSSLTVVESTANFTSIERLVIVLLTSALLAGVMRVVPLCLPWKDPEEDGDE